MEQFESHHIYSEIWKQRDAGLPITCMVLNRSGEDLKKVFYCPVPLLMVLLYFLTATSWMAIAMLYIFWSFGLLIFWEMLRCIKGFYKKKNPKSVFHGPVIKVIEIAQACFWSWVSSFMCIFVVFIRRHLFSLNIVLAALHYRIATLKFTSVKHTPCKMHQKIAGTF